MRKGLGKVAQVSAGFGVELFRVEAQRRRDPKQPFHQVASALELTDGGEPRDEPERADEERPFLARKAVVGLVGLVA